MENKRWQFNEKQLTEWEFLKTNSGWWDGYVEGVRFHINPALKAIAMHTRDSEQWIGIHGVKSTEQLKTLARLVGVGHLRL